MTLQTAARQGVEQRMKRLVDLGRDVGKHFQQPVAAELAGRHQRGVAVGDEGEDRDVLGQQKLAIVELDSAGT